LDILYAMNNDQALEIANELLTREGVVDPFSLEGKGDLQAVSDSLRALVPDVEGAWAVVELIVLPNGDETFPVLLALVDETVWRVGIERRDNVPVVTVEPHYPGTWRVLSVGDRVTEDGFGARILRRGWALAFGDEFISFATEHLILKTPEPDREERLGRALADAQGWEVGDVRFE
jgi:hypothetical protein